MRNQLILSSALLAIAACGGAPKGSVYGSGGKNTPPPPPTIGGSSGSTDPANPNAAKVEVSADAKKDYNAAIANFRETDKGSWSESACKQSADRFTSVVKSHPDLQGLRRWMLATRDAHGLYAQYGFTPVDPDRFMEIRDPDVYKRS